MVRSPLPPSGPGRASGLLFFLLVLSLPEALAGQGVTEGPRRCTLVLEPRPTTRSVSRRVGQDLYVTYLGGGMRWTCGTAVMVADSAVKYDREQRLKMMGSVDYRDSVRTLTADTLTYFEGEDRIVTEGNVRLVRRATGSTLTGPRVVFFRATGGRVGRTVATRRPHVTVPTSGSTEPDLEMDADSVVMLEEDRIHAWGQVVIRRPDARATADSAFFWTDEGRGMLYGSPTVEREDVQLAGDSIHTTFPEGELRTVHALGGARGESRDFELAADRILARMTAGEMDRLSATGEGRSVAFSSRYRLAGDSLDFLFQGGEVDSLVSRGRATAVEMGEGGPGDPKEEVPLTLGKRSWMTGDTIRIAFAPRDSAVPAEDTTGVSTGDSAAASAADSAGVSAMDTAGSRGRTPPGSGPGSADADTVPPADTARTGTAVDTAAEAGTGGPGDTEQGRREIRMIRAIGDARAYYAVREDTTEAGEEGAVRTYQLGREITAYFRAGEVETVTSRDAIGIYLEPRPSAAAPSQPDTAPPEAPGPDTIPRDTIRAAPSDTTRSAPREAPWPERIDDGIDR